MRIGMIGGLDRSVAALQAMAEGRGHEVRFHTGVMAGPASAAALRSLVARAELVIVVTDINSHNAVRTARREARVRGRPVKIVRKMGLTQFAALLQGVQPGTDAGTEARTDAGKQGESAATAAAAA